MKPKLLFIVNEPGFFVSHRLPIAIRAKSLNYDVIVATGEGKDVDKIKMMGFEHHLVPITRSGKSFLCEIKTIISLIKLLKKIKPTVLHLVTIKPVLYGGLAARITRVPAIVAAISGLGSVFSNSTLSSFIRPLVCQLYKSALKHKNIAVIFQNNEDMLDLINIGAINKDNAHLIKGSGVNLTQYRYVPEPEGLGGIVVVMASRLIEEKGVNEFIEAARILSEKNRKVIFKLAGESDFGNPGVITKEIINKSKEIKNLEVVGSQEDIPDFFSKAHIIVLPSYYGEGLPKVLIEAAACGRAIITTDHRGCRDALIKDKTGLLIPIKCAKSLVFAIEKLIDNPSLRKNMGIAGRQLAEKDFDVRNIVEKHMRLYKTLREKIWQQSCE